MGRLPSKLLKDISNHSNDVNFPIDSGSGPESELTLSITSFNDDNFPNEFGIVPEMELYARSRVDSLCSCPNLTGK